MIVLTEQGQFLPAKLQQELVAAGIPVAGVTATESNGVVTGVTIILPDGTNTSGVAAVCAAHVPSWPVVAPKPSVQAKLAAELQRLQGVDANNPVTGQQLANLVTILQSN